MIKAIISNEELDNVSVIVSNEDKKISITLTETVPFYAENNIDRIDIEEDLGSPKECSNNIRLYVLNKAHNQNIKAWHDLAVDVLMVCDLVEKL